MRVASVNTSVSLNIQQKISRNVPLYPLRFSALARTATLSGRAAKQSPCSCRGHKQQSNKAQTPARSYLPYLSLSPWSICITLSGNKNHVIKISNPLKSFWWQVFLFSLRCLYLGSILLGWMLRKAKLWFPCNPSSSADADFWFSAMFRVKLTVRR